MSALAGVNSLSSARTATAMANPAAPSLVGQTSTAGYSTVPGMPHDVLQQAYSGMQQYVGKAVDGRNTSKEQPYQMYKIAGQTMLFLFILIVCAFQYQWSLMCGMIVFLSLHQNVRNVC